MANEFTNEAMTTVQRHLESYAKLISFFRFYPDLMIDFMQGPDGRLKLNLSHRIYLRTLLRSRTLYSVVNRGYGKCVSGDTILVTNNGFQRIDSLIEKNIIGQETVKDLKIKVVNRNGEVVSTSKGIYSGRKPSISIKTSKGYRLEGSYIHPILILNDNNEIEYRKLADIKTGDKVILGLGNKLWGKNNVENAYERGFQEEGNGDFPSDIMQSNKKTMAEFLRGLFDKKSNYRMGSIFLHLENEEFARILQIILLNFGIVSTKKKTNREVEKNLIRIDKNSLQTFYEEIGFKDAQKKEQLRKAIYKYLSALVKEETVEGIDLGELGYTLDEIVKIKKRHIDVYDLTVPNGHSFVGNGFVNHNTFYEVLAGVCYCILYPRGSYSISAQTKEQAATIVGEKFNELCEFVPAIKDELLGKPQISKTKIYIKFKNGSVLNILANAQTTKGSRTKVLSIEESVLVDNTIFEDALQPTTSEGRPTAGPYAFLYPPEDRHQLNFMTTAGFKSTPEYSRFLKMIDQMADLDGAFVFTSDWKMNNWFGRGYSKAKFAEMKKTLPATIFNQNYGSKWVGSVEGAIVTYNQIQKIRNLDRTYFCYPNDGKEHEFYMGVDIARSQKTNNNQSCISIGEVVRGEDGRVKKVKLVYLTLIPNTWETSKQALMIKKIGCDFKIKGVAVDGNGVGSGIIDALASPQIDGTNVYGAWNVQNERDTRQPIDPKAPYILYNFKAGSGNNPETISNFINFVDSEILSILPETKEDDWTTVNEENLFSEFIPKKETECFIAELYNLRIQINGRLIKVEQVDKTIDKDRYSSVAYMLWYIKTFAETLSKRTAFEITGDLKKAFGVGQQSKKYSPFGNRFSRKPFGEGGKGLFR